MNGMVFVELPCENSEAQPLNGEVAYYPPDSPDPLQHFLAHMVTQSRDYRITYTAGHYGELEHQWVFSHYEVYEPQDPQLPSMVILRYRQKGNHT